MYWSLYIFLEAQNKNIILVFVDPDEHVLTYAFADFFG